MIHENIKESSRKGGKSHLPKPPSKEPRHRPRRPLFYSQATPQLWLTAIVPQADLWHYWYYPVSLRMVQKTTMKSSSTLPAPALAALLCLLPGFSTATESGGFATATGSTEAAVTVTSLAELQAAVNARKHHIVVKGTIYGGAALETFRFASTDWNNLTIEGESGGAAALENIQLKFSGEKLPAGTNIENVVVRNLTFHGHIADLQAMPPQIYGTAENIGINYLGVSFRRVSNLWVDHCTIYDTSDDLMSVTQASDNATISYNHFYFTDEWVNMTPNPEWNWVGKLQDLANERLAMVIGMNPKDSHLLGNKSLHVTLHHNWFGPNIKGRPLMRGFVHAYNNYFDNSNAPTGKTTGATTGTQYAKGQYNALQIGSGGVIYSESNYFLKTNTSHQIGLDKPDDPYTFAERNNIYEATTGKPAAGEALTDVPVPYHYTADPATEVPAIVKAKAGPR
jgi:pectate lyase